MQLFLHFIKIRKISKGGTLGRKKIKVLQSGRNLQDWWGPSKKQAGTWFWSVLAPCWALSDQKRKTMQRGDPWNKKNSKCSDLDETCRTGGDHQKNKLGSDFEVFLHLVGHWGIKKESGYYWFLTTSTLWIKNFKNCPKSTKLAGLVGKCFGSVFATVLCTVGDGKSQKLGRNAAEGTTKSGGFSSK